MPGLVRGLLFLAFATTLYSAAPDPVRDGRALSRWLEDLKYPHAEVPFEALRTLSRIPGAASAARAELSALGNDSDGDVRRLAVRMAAEPAASNPARPPKSTIRRQPQFTVPAPAPPRPEPLFAPASGAELEAVCERLREPARRVEALGKLLEFTGAGWSRPAPLQNAGQPELASRALSALQEWAELGVVVEGLGARAQDASRPSGERLGALVPLIRLWRLGPQPMGSVGTPGTGHPVFDESCRQAGLALNRAVDPLLVEHALGHPDWDIRNWGLRTFGSDRVAHEAWAPSLPLLRRMAAEGEAGFRAAALDRLRRFPGFREFLKERLQVEANPDVLMRLVLAWHGRVTPAYRAEFLELFRPLLDHTNEAVRLDALQFIGEHNNPARAEMYRFAFSQDVVRRVAAIARSPSEGERPASAHALRALSQVDPEVSCQTFCELAHDRSPAVRTQAAWGFKAVSARPEAQRALATLIQDPVPSVRWSAILADGASKHRSELEALAKCDDPQTAGWAAEHLATSSVPIAPPQTPRTWQRWEHALTSSRSYANPFAEVILRVTYTGPGGRALRTYGFWDGGETFRIRCAFPVAGEWEWETECSDTSNSGLHHQHGRVNVAPYEGPNTLYRLGFLKVSDNRRYLTYGDGTPFLWVGDTAWAAPQRASGEEWRAYLADRATKHFTVIQVGPASQWAGPSDRQGEKPFTDRTCSEWNPAYWQHFEEKVQRANEAGLVVVLVGLMEPVHRYPEADRACLFARNIVARLFGNFVIFSPSFDSNFMPLANEVGRAAREATSVHLITQHPGTPWNQPTPTFSVQYYEEPYLDFVGVQSGHNGGHLDRCAHHASEWNLHLYRHEPHKPVVNLEAMYDAQGTNGWRAVDARGLGWRTFLSGACGYTYGAGDVPPKVPQGGGALWKWVTDPAKYDYWRKALQWESAFQMQHLHDFLAVIEWWRLEPAHDLIRDQPTEVTRRRVLAKTAAGDLAVAYLPDNEAIEVDLSSFPAPLAARWFDPVQGRYSTIDGRIANGGAHRFTPPGEGDWVLLLQRSP